MSLNPAKMSTFKDKIDALEKEKEAVVEEIVATKKATKRASKDT